MGEEEERQVRAVAQEERELKRRGSCGPWRARVARNTEMPSKSAT
jgi:hypothetical protein